MLNVSLLEEIERTKILWTLSTNFICNEIDKNVLKTIQINDSKHERSDKELNCLISILFYLTVYHYRVHVADVLKIHHQYLLCILFLFRIQKLPNSIKNSKHVS